MSEELWSNLQGRRYFGRVQEVCFTLRRPDKGLGNRNVKREISLKITKTEIN